MSKGNKKKPNLWPIKVFAFALVLAIVFGLFSELVLDGASVTISVLVLVFFLVLALFSDMIGIAVTTCDKVPFLSMASRKIRGAKSSLWLIKRQDKVASVCCDIIGDISAIISGSVGLTLAYAIAQNVQFSTLTTTVVVSSVIASFTVGCKAIVKTYSIKNSHKIVKAAGKLILFFGIGK